MPGPRILPSRRNRLDPHKHRSATPIANRPGSDQRERALKALKTRISELEARIADREKAIKDVEKTMAAPDFYSDHEKSKPVLNQHQALMWEVGELLAQWEMLQKPSGRVSSDF